ncbi:MAG: hypothetical protein PVJ33_00630 [Lysobacterales bacterium]|jgi:hypothetical protein
MSKKAWLAFDLGAESGRAQNVLLNQKTVDACGLPVIAGPYLAIAVGNAPVQAMG